MSRPDDPLRAALPLARLDLLAAAIGRTLVDVERHLVERPEDVAARGLDPAEHLARASGATDLTFSGGLVHGLAAWPSELSVIVEPTPAPADPFAPVVRLSDVATPAWLRACLGRIVADVRVYVYREDDVDSPEARQAAVSYLLAPDVELVYCTYLHGRMDGDELVTAAELDPARIARWVSARDAAAGPG